jgi:formate hydrogenlyase subunit 3/multisubunit Na+/H+ antiporter MnhD subunit
MPAGLLLACVAALLVLALAAALPGRRDLTAPLVYPACLVLSAVLLAGAAGHLVGNAAPKEIVLPLGLPWIGAHFRIDAVSAFFLAVINLGAVAACVYGIGYGRHEQAPERVLPFMPAFLAAMNMVIMADDAFTFLLSWEFMSLASWALVLAHHRDPENSRAAYVYILMASVGTLSLLLAFGLLAGPDGAYDFASIRAGTATPLSTALVLALVLVGAGSKAGLVPLHVWLPLAHPAAPSHVSALMSGVMTKVAVYGFVRIVLDLLGPPDWWWGLVVIALGAMSAVIGILFALLQSDLKRVLAYSTIENIGFVFVGLGLALAFEANQLTTAAALALTAALFHVLNHSLIKSLLFFGAGAVLTATGERNMERLGGLIHRMPATAALFLTGSVAISALPPLNGFASEWLTLQAILLSPQSPQWGLKILVPAAGALLALSAALAAACFVRAFGITFLGRPRSPVAAEAGEVDRWSLGAMAGLGLACVLAGILPGVVIDGLAPAVESLTGARMPVQTAVAWWSIVPISESRSSYNGLLVFAFIAASTLLTVWAIHRFASSALRRAPAWDCGFPNADPATQYTAGSFAQPIRRVFQSVGYRARETLDMPSPGDLRPARFSLVIGDFAWDTLYAPTARAIDFAAGHFNRLQFLTIRRYLSLVFFSLVSLLLMVALWP